MYKSSLKTSWCSYCRVCHLCTNKEANNELSTHAFIHDRILNCGVLRICTAVYLSLFKPVPVVFLRHWIETMQNFGFLSMYSIYHIEIQDSLCLWWGNATEVTMNLTPSCGDITNQATLTHGSD